RSARPLAGRSTAAQKQPGSTATAAAAINARIISAVTNHHRGRRLAIIAEQTRAAAQCKQLISYGATRSPNSRRPCHLRPAAHEARVHPWAEPEESGVLTARNAYRGSLSFGLTAAHDAGWTGWGPR